MQSHPPPPARTRSVRRHTRTLTLTHTQAGRFIGPGIHDRTVSCRLQTVARGISGSVDSLAHWPPACRAVTGLRAPQKMFALPACHSRGCLCPQSVTVESASSSILTRPEAGQLFRSPPTSPSPAMTEKKRNCSASEREKKTAAGNILFRLFRSPPTSPRPAMTEKKRNCSASER